MLLFIMDISTLKKPGKCLECHTLWVRETLVWIRKICHQYGDLKSDIVPTMQILYGHLRLKLLSWQYMHYTYLHIYDDGDETQHREILIIWNEGISVIAIAKLIANRLDLLLNLQFSLWTIMLQIKYQKRLAITRCSHLTAVR